MDHDGSNPPTVAELYDKAERYFPGVMNELYREFLAASKARGRLSVIDELCFLPQELQANMNLGFSGSIMCLSAEMMSFILLKRNGLRNSNRHGIELAIGEATPVPDTFHDSAAFKLTLLFNKLLDTDISLHVNTRAGLEPGYFPFHAIDSSSSTRSVLDPIMLQVNLLCEVLHPTVELHALDTGENICVNVGGEVAAVVGLSKPCAYSLAVDPVLGETRVKRTVCENGKCRYTTSNGQDVEWGMESYKRPVEDLHRGLAQTLYDAITNNCRQVAVSDGFTFLGATMGNLIEKGAMVEVDFDSYHAVDMTAIGSSLEILQYFINKVYGSDEVRRYSDKLLNAAQVFFGRLRITRTRAIDFAYEVRRATWWGTWDTTFARVKTG